MKKKIVLSLGLIVILVASIAIGAYAASDIKLWINGKEINTDIQIVNGSSYVPLRVVSDNLGATIKWDGINRKITISGKVAPVHAPPEDAVTIKDVSIKIDKVVQDSDSLRLHISYINNSNSEALILDSQAKIVSNGEQFEYSHDFNFDRYYNTGVDKAPSGIESGVTAKSIIFFEPIIGVDKINVVLNADFNDYRFYDVKLE